MCTKYLQKDKNHIEHQLRKFIIIGIFGIITGILLVAQSNISLEGYFLESSPDEQPQSTPLNNIEGEQLEFVHHITPKDGTELIISESEDIIIETQIDLNEVRESYGREELIIGVRVEDRERNSHSVIGIEELLVGDMEGKENYEYSVDLSQLEANLNKEFNSGESKNLLITTHIAYGSSNNPEIVDSHETSFKLTIREEE